MAQYRFSTSNVSRGKGAGAIKRAAYNGRCRLEDERTGQIWDYSKRKGLEWSGIFAPDNAPEWVKDRQRLWNEAVRAEDRSTRRDTAREARDFKISLPHELTARQREWLVKDFARYLSRKGMIVDASIHSPDPHSDSRHYHAHILTTTRDISPAGFGKKNREWNKTEELEKWREKFAEMGAHQLERAGYKLEAERYREAFRSNAVQRVKAVARGDMQHADSLDREPTKPLGPHAAAMERKGIRTVRGAANERIVAANEERKKGLTMGNSKGGKAKVAARLGKTLERSLSAAADGFASLIAPTLTPEQERDAQIARLLREEDTKRDRGRER